MDQQVNKFSELKQLCVGEINIKLFNIEIIISE